MNFYKKYDTYDKNAVVQKKAAEKLVRMMEENLHISYFKSVCEIGCGTGIFTRRFLKKFKVENLVLNDIFDTRKYLKDINYDEFILKDMDTEEFSKYQIIISSSVFQWSKDFENLIKNISNSCKYLAFSIYLSDNFLEIKNHFGISLKYFTGEEIENILKKYFREIKREEEIFTEDFNSPLEALRHLRDTGTTGFKKAEIKKIRSFSEKILTYKIRIFFM